MNAAYAITIYTVWRKDRDLFLYGVDRNGLRVPPVRLKTILFAWHQPSFYGSLIHEGELGGHSGLLLSPLMALHYFSDPRPLIHAAVVWSEETMKWLQTAPFLQDALKNGWFAPDYASWTVDHPGWKLWVPDGNMPDHVSSAFANQWLTMVINEMTESSADVRETWDRLTQAYPLLTHTANHQNWSEDDWLTTIGWMKDDLPFRTCLRLVEPEEGDEWLLQILLQDRSNHDLLFECDHAGNPVHEAYPAEWRAHLDRLKKAEERWLRILPWLENPEEPGRIRTRLTHQQAWEILTEGSVRLVEAGVTLFLPSWWESLKKPQHTLKASLKPYTASSPEPLLGMSTLMQFDWKLAIDDVELSEEEFQQLLEQKQRLIRVRGRWVQLDLALLQRMQSIVKRVNPKKGLTFRDALEIHLAGSLPEGDPSTDVEETGLSFLHMEVEWSKQLARIVRQLVQLTDIPLIEQPAAFHGTLRHYQLAGSSWLLFLRRFGLGGCLADDMGLGKTIQLIAYLLHLKETEPPATPALLICPTSVLGNWQKEMERFAPSLKVHLHYGSNRSKGEAFLPSIADADVVITTYALSYLDESELASIRWSTICLDEAQQIKNIHTKQSQAVRRLDAIHRIALTGTPVENRLTELWSIADFLNPGYLGSLNQFTRRFVHPIEKTNDSERIGKVQRLIRPFLLRRVKTDPAIQLDLPDKNEAKAFVSLTAEQAALYETIIQEMFEKIAKASAMERRGLILASLTKLKQLCNHPALLLKEKQTRWQNRSNKLERLLEMVDELRQEGDRCLIFTQFVETGHFLQQILQTERQEMVHFLHGGVPKSKRDQMVAHFQDESLPEHERCPIFILSLKAGGTGLNLTAANHVFHFDRWWNPAVENQATDRVFRIGQTRNVQVHKFITLGTVEERIDEMIERKQGWSRQVIGNGENWITELSTDELRELFSLRREWLE